MRRVRIPKDRRRYGAASEHRYMRLDGIYATSARGKLLILGYVYTLRLRRMWRLPDPSAYWHGLTTWFRKASAVMILHSMSDPFPLHFILQHPNGAISRGVMCVILATACHGSHCDSHYCFTGSRCKHCISDWRYYSWRLHATNNFVAYLRCVRISLKPTSLDRAALTAIQSCADTWAIGAHTIIFVFATYILLYAVVCMRSSRTLLTRADLPADVRAFKPRSRRECLLLWRWCISSPSYNLPATGTSSSWPFGETANCCPLASGPILRYPLTSTSCKLRLLELLYALALPRLTYLLTSTRDPDSARGSGHYMASMRRMDVQ